MINIAAGKSVSTEDLADITMTTSNNPVSVGTTPGTSGTQKRRGRPPGRKNQQRTNVDAPPQLLPARRSQRH